MAHRYKDPFTGKSKRQVRLRKKKGRRKLEKLYKIGGDSWFPWPVSWSNYEWKGEYSRAFPADNSYLVRNYRGKCSKKIKKACNHSLRKKLKNPEYECGNGCSYRKHTEFWWELY